VWVETALLSWASRLCINWLIPRIPTIYVTMTTQTVTAGQLDKCQIMEKTLQVSGNPNEYDTRIFQTYDDIFGLFSNDSHFNAFMNSPELQVSNGSGFIW